MNNDLVLVQASLAEFDAVEAGLVELETKYKGVAYAVDTTKGMAEAVAARAEIRRPRINAEKAREAGKKPIIEIGRSLDRRAKEITARLVAIEEPIDEQIKAEEKRKAAEKAERERIESERVARRQALIYAINSVPLGMAGKNSQNILCAIDSLRQKDYSDLEEFVLFAENARTETLKSLEVMHQAALAKEQREAAEAAARKAEEERLAEERKKLAEAQEALRKQQEAARIKVEAEEAELAKRKRDQEAAEAKLEADRKSLQEQQDLLLKQKEAKSVPVADAEDEKQATFLKTLDYQKPAERTPADEIVYLVNELLHDHEFMNHVEMFVRDDALSTITNPFETFENLASEIEKYEATK